MHCISKSKAPRSTDLSPAIRLNPATESLQRKILSVKFSVKKLSDFIYKKECFQQKRTKPFERVN